MASRNRRSRSEAVTDSNIPPALGAPHPLLASAELLATAERVAADTGVELTTGTIFSSDIFYEPDDSMHEARAAAGVLVVEMESAALYAISALEGAEALTLVTTTDHLVTGEQLTADERQTSVDEMLELALRVATT